MKRKTFIIFIMFFVFLFLEGCSLSDLTAHLFSSPTAPATQPSQTVEPPQNITIDKNVLDNLQDIYQGIYTRVNPSVVNIQVVSADFFGTSTGQGSGFVWDALGHIVTNNHVIDGASEISVTFSDGKTFSADVVGADPQSDLAVIRVDPSGAPLVPIKLGNSQEVQVGDLVIAIGNPYGLSGTMTQGIVSALSRSLTIDQSDWFSQTTYTIPDIIQTDAAINPGNSGGVLVNMNAEVIGVTSAIRSSSGSNAGIGFVIPAHIVNRIVPVLISDGLYRHPGLGLSGITLTTYYASHMGLNEDATGVLITDIVSGGPADKAGLTPSYQQMVAPGRIRIVYGDVITAIDGHPVKTYEDMISYIFNQTEVGQRVIVTFLRDGKTKTVDLVLQAN